MRPISPDGHGKPDEEYRMTVLEKIGSPPARLGGTALYDWDYLVQEDRAHRLIYTDPAIFDDPHFRRYLDLSGARKRNSG